MYKYYVYIFSLAQQQMTHGPPQVRNPEVLQQFDAVIRTCPRKMYDLYFFSWPGTKWPMTQTWPGAQRLVNCALKKGTIFYYIFKYLHVQEVPVEHTQLYSCYCSTTGLFVYFLQ